MMQTTENRSGLAAGSAALVTLLTLTLLSLSVRSASSLPDVPLTEDGYYQLSVARNLAAGHGLTIDGERWTNGFQPLFTFICAPAYWITGGDRLSTLRLVLLLHTLVQLATAWCLALIVRDASEDDEQRQLRFWATMILWMAAPGLVMQHHNGLETGFLLLMYAVTGRLYQLRGTGSVRNCVALGVVLGLLVLTRIDAAFMAAMLGASQWFLPGSLLQRGRRFAILAVVSLLVSSPWWLYNLTQFGSLMPSSGTAQQELGVDSKHRLISIVYATTQVLTPAQVMTPVRYLGRYERFATVGLRVAAIFAVLWYAIRQDKRRDRRSPIQTLRQRALWYGGCLCATFSMLIPYYLVKSDASWFYERYFSPLSLVAVFATVEVVASVTIKTFRWRTYQLLGLESLLALQAVLFIVGLTRAGLLFHCTETYCEQLPLVTSQVPDSAEVAAFQSGALGYFRDRVTNLDGKVNSDALRRQDDMGTYLDEKQIDWYCEYRFFSNDPRQKNRWEHIAQDGIFGLYHRIDARPALSKSR